MSQPDINSGAPAAQAAEWWIALAQGALSPDERRSLDLWLAADPLHRTLLDNAADAWRAIERQAAYADMIALRGEALRQAHSVQRAQRWRRFGRRGEAAAAVIVAAVIALAAGSAWFIQRPATYATGLGERRLVVLPDGSKLSLDALTRVDVRYSSDRRRFWLRNGRARFDVAKNPLRPFTVDANGKLVVATGTQFSVELLRKQLRVALYEGHVAILDDRAYQGGGPARPSSAEPPGAHYLAPGDELIASTASDPGMVRPLASANSEAWEEGQLVFADETLATVVERANRYGHEKLVLATQAAGERRISGVFTAGDTASLIMGITAVLPIRAEEDHGVIQLSLIAQERNPIAAGVGSPP